MISSFSLCPVLEVVESVTMWSPSKGSDESIRYIDVSAVSREKLKITGVATHTPHTAPSRARKVVRANDTLFATIRPALKRVAQVPQHLDGAVASSAFCVLRPAAMKVDADFLFFAASSDAFVAQVADLQTGASYPAVRDNDVLSSEIPLPSLDEQRRIASVLRTVRRSLSTETELVDKALTLKGAAMRELFTRGLREEAGKTLAFGEVPESWRLVRLSDVAEVQTGAAKGRQFADSDVVDVPYLRVANVQDGHLDLAEIKLLRVRRQEIERYRLRDGDVVLTEGGDFDKLGRGFIWRSELPLCIHQNHVFAVRTNRAVLDPEFFAYLAQSPYGKAYFLQVAHKTTNLACINSNKLKAFPVVLPSLEEQREICGILQAVDKKIAIHKQKRDLLDDLFKSLLHKLMCGEIRVSELDLSALQEATIAQVSA